MTIDRLREAVSAEPFRAFKLRFASGAELRVPHPEFVWIHPQSPRTIVIGVTAGGLRVVDLLLVEALEYEPKRDGRAGGNGAQRRRKP